jgi:hypothetical protein
MPVAQLPIPESPRPGWEFAEGIGYTRVVGPLHLHVWEQHESAVRRFSWSVRLSGFLVTSCWGTRAPADAHGAMVAAEAAALFLANSIIEGLR